MVFSRKDNLLIYHVWSEETYDDIINAIEAFPVKKLEFNCTTEWTPMGDIFNSDFVRLLFVCKAKNIEVDLLLGSTGFDDYPDSHKEQLNKLPNINVKAFPYYFIKETINKLKAKPDEAYSRKEGFIFSCLSNRPHLHRCLFMDEAHRTGLDRKMFFTWNKLQEQYKEGQGELYTFKHWKETIVKDIDKYEERLIYKQLPEDWYQSAFDIVLESNTECVFFTEKTWKPIMQKKPFISLGGRFFHKRLQELGFVLYDDIIDYSFDLEEDLEKRVKMYVEQLNKISKLGYNKIIEVTRRRVEHNYKQLYYQDSKMHENLKKLKVSEKLLELITHNVVII